MERFADEWGAQSLFADQSRAVAAAAHAERLRQTERGLAAVLRGLGTGVMRPLWDRLGEVALPVTLVVGERDAKYRGLAEEMARALRDASVVVVPGRGARGASGGAGGGRARDRGEGGRERRLGRRGGAAAPGCRAAAA